MIVAASYGWMAWAKNGEQAGTQGMSRRAEAIQVALVRKDAPAPAPDATYKGGHTAVREGVR